MNDVLESIGIEELQYRLRQADAQIQQLEDDLEALRYENRCLREQVMYEGGEGDEEREEKYAGDSP